MGNMQFSDFDKEVLKKIEDLDKNTKEKLKKVADEWNLTMTKLQSKTEMTSIEKLENEYKKLSELLDKNIEINNEWTNLKEKISKNKNIDDTQKYIFHETILKMQGFILLEIYKCSSDFNRIGNYINEKKREDLKDKIMKQKDQLLTFNDELQVQSRKLINNEGIIKKQNKKIKINNRKIDRHDKRVLEMMGIFLTIFSILGMNVLTIPSIKYNIVQNIMIINAIILLTMSGLFFLIRFEFSCEKIVLFLVPVILASVMIFFDTVNIKDKNKEIENRMETVIEDNKMLKQEIEILKQTK